MTVHLCLSGLKVNPKRVLRSMKKLGFEGIYPKPNLSKLDKENLKFPYLLKPVEINYLK